MIETCRLTGSLNVIRLVMYIFSKCITNSNFSGTDRKAEIGTVVYSFEIFKIIATEVSRLGMKRRGANN